VAAYSVLNAMPARDFLDPSKFVTESDARNKARGYDAEQYAKGLEIGKNAKTIYISCGSVWSAELKSGSSLLSYEGIGYHACTADLLRGFLDSGCAIIVHRLTEGVVKIK
jgi:hypothetical protein